MGQDAKPLIAVFNASGRIGRQVVDGLLKSGQYRVRAVVRSLSSKPVAEYTQLAQDGADIEVFNVSMDDYSSIQKSIQGCSGVFLSTKTVFEEEEFEHKEIERGQNIVEACHRLNVRHLVYHTQMEVEFAIGILARQNDAKGFIEKKIRELGVPSTGLMLPVPYDTLLDLHCPVRDKADHMPGETYRLEIPMGELPYDGLALSDVGPITVSIFNQGPRAFDKDYIVTAGKLSVCEMAQILSRELKADGVSVRDGKITVALYKKRSFPGAEDIANLYDFMSNMHARANLELTRQLNPNVQKFDSWVRNNKDALLQAMRRDAIEAQRIPVLTTD